MPRPNLKLVRRSKPGATHLGTVAVSSESLDAWVWAERISVVGLFTPLLALGTWRRSGYLGGVAGAHTQRLGLRTLRSSSMTWQKQALHGEISEPERISHPVHHKVQQLFADGYF
jgi:hypothetical protein